jgi:hypothetical protein
MIDQLQQHWQRMMQRHDMPEPEVVANWLKTYASEDIVLGIRFTRYWEAEQNKKAMQAQVNAGGYAQVAPTVDLPKLVKFCGKTLADMLKKRAAKLKRTPLHITHNADGTSVVKLERDAGEVYWQFDTADFPRVLQAWPWIVISDGKRFSVARVFEYTHPRTKNRHQKRVYAQDFLLQTEAGQRVYFRDGDPTNCTRRNMSLEPLGDRERHVPDPQLVAWYNEHVEAGELLKIARAKICGRRVVADDLAQEVALELLETLNTRFQLSDFASKEKFIAWMNAIVRNRAEARSHQRGDITQENFDAQRVYWNPEWFPDGSFFTPVEDRLCYARPTSTCDTDEDGSSGGNRGQVDAFARSDDGVSFDSREGDGGLVEASLHHGLDRAAQIEAFERGALEKEDRKLGKKALKLRRKASPMPADAWEFESNL